MWHLLGLSESRHSSKFNVPSPEESTCWKSDFTFLRMTHMLQQGTRSEHINEHKTVRLGILRNPAHPPSCRVCSLDDLDVLCSGKYITTYHQISPLYDRALPSWHVKIGHQTFSGQPPIAGSWNKLPCPFPSVWMQFLHPNSLSSGSAE